MGKFKLATVDVTPYTYRWGIHVDAHALILLKLESANLCWVSVNIDMTQPISTEGIVIGARQWTELHYGETVVMAEYLGPIAATLTTNGWFITAGSEPLALLVTTQDFSVDEDLITTRLRRDQLIGFWYNSNPAGWPETITDEVISTLLNQLADAYVRTIQGDTHVQRSTRTERHETTP